MTAPDIISAARISDVWRALGGGELRNGRGRAWWRDGDGWSVSLDDQRRVWYDHRDGIGGGVLDLLVHVRGGTCAEALRWLADYARVPLDDRPLTRHERAKYEQRHQAAEQEARELLDWRAGILEVLRAWRDSHFHAYHRAKGTVILTGLESDIGQFAADVADVAEANYERLDRQIEALRDAPFRDLLQHFRGWKAVAA